MGLSAGEAGIAIAVTAVERPGVYVLHCIIKGASRIYPEKTIREIRLMNIYYSGIDGTRRLQNCNLSESEVSDVQVTDGVQTYKIYMIFNTAEGDSTIITFGGKSQIAENLRDSFWRCIAKHSVPTFDVDEWHANIIFVTLDNQNVKKNKMKNSLKKSK